MQHAYVIEASLEDGTARARAFIEKELGMHAAANPDVVVLNYGLLTAEDARRIGVIAAQAPVAGARKAIIVAAQRAYHEAQNALLKLFEEPPRETYIFLVVSAVGSLLPTLRSRVVLLTGSTRPQHALSKGAAAFIRATREGRSNLIKKLAAGRDEDERRENREEAIEILRGVEEAVIASRWHGDKQKVVLLEDIATLRGYLYDRSAPLRMILEHVSLLLPGSLR